VIALASEMAKRDSFWGALLVALPLTSILAISWLYAETRDNALVTRFARDIFLLVPDRCCSSCRFCSKPGPASASAQPVRRAGAAGAGCLGNAPDSVLNCSAVGVLRAAATA